MFLGTGYGYIKQTAFLFQLLVRVACHRTGEEVFFQPHDENILEFQPLGRVNGHQRHLHGIVISLAVLIGKQRNFRKIVSQQDMRVALLFTVGTEIVHTVYQFLDIFLTAQVLGRTVLINIADNARLLDDILTQLVGTGLRNSLHESGNQAAESLQFGVRTFRQFQSVGQRFSHHFPQADLIAVGCIDNLV